MSIIAYVGLPGSGKSYDVVANQIMPALEAGRRVVTNIPLNRDAIREITLDGEVVFLPYEKVQSNPEVIDEYARAGCLLVLDEVWRIWPSGLKAHQIPQAYKSLLAEHRHRVDGDGRSMQIVLVTQDLAQIAAFARQLVEQTFHHTKLAHMGARSSYRIDVFHGAVTGAVPPKSNRLREIFGKYDPRIFALYQSHTMSDSHKSGADEKGHDDRGNFWRRPVLYVGAAGVIVMVGFAVTTFASLGDKYQGDEMSEANSVALEPSPKPGPVFSASPVVEPEPKKPLTLPNPLRRVERDYRLVGTIENHDGGESLALITDGKRQATISLADCQAHAVGDYICEYDGAEISLFGSSMK